MNKLLRNLLLAAGILVAGHAAAEVTFFENDGFQGRSFTTDRTIRNFDGSGFNDRASSAVVRGGSWEVCTDAQFEGRCVTLRPGDYASMRDLGLNDRISSVREVESAAREGMPGPYARDDRRAHRYDNPNVAPNYAPNAGGDRPPVYGPNAANDRYEYRNDGWRFDRLENRWERY